jgi:hypothetical protein
METTLIQTIEQANIDLVTAKLASDGELINALSILIAEAEVKLKEVQDANTQSTKPIL